MSWRLIFYYSFFQVYDDVDAHYKGEERKCYSWNLETDAVDFKKNKNNLFQCKTFEKSFSEVDVVVL